MFASREVAGILLGEFLMGKESENTVVIGIPRGGVVTGVRVARMLHVPCDVVFVKKITAASDSELAIGAAGEEGEVYWNEEATKDMKDIEKKEALKQAVQSILQKKRGTRSFFPERSLEGKDVILVDDGVATGYTVLCAATVVKGKGAKTVSLATPVIAQSTYKKLRDKFTSIYTLHTPHFFHSVGEYYENFPQVSDSEVQNLLQNLH